MHRTRRYVIISIMIALSVVGRFIPFFKPVAALTIISGIYIGVDAGIMVGSFSILLSNFYFGQGPWTPFQMLGWGMIGFMSGFLAKPLKKSKVFLLVFGVLSGVLLEEVGLFCDCDETFCSFSEVVVSEFVSSALISD